MILPGFRLLNVSRREGASGKGVAPQAEVEKKQDSLSEKKREE